MRAGLKPAPTLDISFKNEYNCFHTRIYAEEVTI